MKKSLRLIALLLALLAMSTAAVSCGSDKTDTPAADTTTAAAGTDETTVSEQTLTPAQTPVAFDEDYGGYDFRVIVMENDEAAHIIEEIEAETANGETLNDAIYARNLAVMEKLNVKITTTHNSGVLNAVKKSVQAGDDTWDLALPTVYDAFSLASVGALTEVHELPNVDFTKDWWASDILTDTSIANKNYFAVSDISMHTYGSAQVLAYNKTLASNYNVSDLYALVNSGEWTYGKMIEECKKVSNDINGDGVMDENDVYGIGHLSSSAIIFPYSADLFFVTKDSEDIPSIALSERFVSFFQQMVEDFSNTDYSMYTERYGSPLRNTAGGTAFNEDRLLLYRLDLSYIVDFRDMTSDFGIIPTPKYDAAQENYVTVIHPGAMSAIAVPVTNPDIDRTSAIIEEMSYQSYQYTKPAYIEVAIKTKYSRDEESAQMLDLILSNFRLDLAFGLANSGLSITGDMRELLNKFDTNVTSAFEKKAEKYQNALDKVVDKIVG
ncbi:MAG: hypothetical protein WCQ72_00410 [Eubacteriales bacterium]